MKNKFSLLVAMTISMVSFGQIRFEPGSFVDNNGVRIDCVIRNLDWQNNPNSFEYKTAAEPEPQRATLETARAFKVGDFDFRKWTVNIDRSSQDVADISQHRNPEFAVETLFLQLIFSGEIDLYQYSETKLTRFFIATGNQVPKQLIFKEYKIDEVNIGQNNQFRQQLHNALGNRNSVSDKEFAKLKYTRKDLLSLLARTDTGKGAKSVSALQKAKFRYKITAGVALATVVAENWADEEFFGEIAEHKLTPVIGAEVELVLPSNRGKWTVFANPAFSSYSASKTGEVNKDLKYTFVQLPIGARYYMHLDDNRRLFVNGGLSLNMPISSSLEVNTDYDIPDPDVPIETLAFGAFAGAGCAFGKLSVEARFDVPRRLVGNSEFWHIKYHSISLLAAYSFN